MENFVEVKNIIKSFGDFTAVNDVSFEVARGEVLGFLGPNGAGKTTTMRMIAGYLEPTGGSVKICNLDAETEQLKAQARIGYLPEGAPLYPDMTPRMLLKFSCQAYGVPKKDIKSKIDMACEKLNLEQVLDQAIDTLSKGFKRRVGLALAILHDPDVLILDEPTDGLDPNQKHEVRELIKSMAKDKAIIISTHILEEVEAVCSRAIIIASGKIVADGTPEELLKRSEYHGAVSLILSDVEKDEALDQLASLKGVSRIETSDEQGNKLAVCVIPANADTNIIQDVSALVSKKKWQVENLSLRHGKMEDVFRKLTSEQDKAA